MDRETLLAQLKAASIHEKEVRGVKLRVRGMTLAERIAFFERTARFQETGESDPSITDAGIAARYVVDENGAPIFDAQTIETELGAELVREIGNAIFEASGLATASAETARKNS